MGSIKRWYFYIVCAISLQSIVWAVIVLLRNRSLDSVAFQAAVIIVGLPIFLLHWRWATRSEGEEDGYAKDDLRLLYLLTMLSAFLIPIITNSVGLLGAIFRMILGIENQGPYAWSTPPPNSDVAINSAVAILVLGLFGLYHLYLIREENLLSDHGVPATLRRVFVYFFTAFSLSLFTAGLIKILQWLLTEFSTTRIDPALIGLTDAAARLIIGLAVWILFWRAAQKLYFSGNEEEKESALRKFYLYLVVFICTITVVSDLAIIGASQLRRLLGLKPAEDTGIVMSSLIVGAIIWAYHHYVLREDSHVAPDVETGASIRRVYWYIIAGVGLLALLGGLAGEISVIVNVLSRSGGVLVTNPLRETLSWSTAALVAGLLVWIIPWRKIQQEVELPDPAGINARKAGVRRYYLYGFILLATLTFLGCAVFLVYALISNLLGYGGSDFTIKEISQSIAYAIMAVLVWLYHGSILRSDNQALKMATPEIGEAPAIAILDDEDGRLGGKIRSALQTTFPKANLNAVGLTAVAREALLPDGDQPETVQILRGADIIVGPWTIATPYAGPQPDEEGVFAALAASPAHKVLIPKAEENWDWSGVASWKEDTAVRQAVEAVKQIVAGEIVSAQKPLGIGRIILIIVGVFFLLNFIFMLISMFSGFLF